MRTTRLLAATAAAALATTIVPSAPSSAAAPPEVDAAVAWLIDQQQPDGGFELAAFPGFETPDAALALATAAQSGATWDAAEALAAVEAVETGGNDPLDALDAWVDTTHADAGATTATKAQQVANLRPQARQRRHWQPSIVHEDQRLAVRELLYIAGNDLLFLRLRKRQVRSPPFIHSVYCARARAFCVSSAHKKAPLSRTHREKGA
mgnify:CR=1 FL=1